MGSRSDRVIELVFGEAPGISWGLWWDQGRQTRWLLSLWRSRCIPPRSQKGSLVANPGIRRRPRAGRGRDARRRARRECGLPGTGVPEQAMTASELVTERLETLLLARLTTLKQPPTVAALAGDSYRYAPVSIGAAVWADRV